jgi:hypothetical protein
MICGPTARLHAFPIPEFIPILADYPACILITTPTAMWPFYMVQEDMLKQQYNIYLHQKKFLG